MEPNAAFGVWVKHRRRTLALTQAELAQRVAYSIVTIRRVESGDLRPSRALAGRLADALDIPPAERDVFIQFARGTAHAGEPQVSPPALPLPAEAAARQAVGRLPVPLTPLIGREKEVAAIRALLQRPAVRLLTLTGPGGMGKTRLALQVALEHVGVFGDGVHFVSLASLSDTGFIVPALASALDLPAAGQKDPHAQLIAFLRDKHLLLVLDNCEHLDGAGFFAEILQHAPRVTLLATSRERLHLPGEWVIEVHGLPVPPRDTPAGEDLARYGAVALFLELARRTRPDFDPAADKAAVADICRLVEGMPLALELAAAWTRVLTVEEIAREMMADVGFLAGALRGVPERHQSLQAVFDHSWKLLTEEERRVAGQVSVFRGGFGSKAARDVANASLPLLASLVDKSLLQRSAEGRYTMHELLRQDAFNRLSAAGEAGQTRTRHLAFFLRLVEEAEPQLAGPEQRAWLALLETELDNLRAALHWALDEEADPEAGLKMAGKLWWFWYLRGHWSEGRRWLTKRHPAVNLRLQVGQQLVGHTSFLALFDGDVDAMQAFAEEGIALSRELGDKETLALMLSDMGLGVGMQGDYARARDYLGQALALHREQGDASRVADTLINLGSVAMLAGDFQGAGAALDEALAMGDKLGDGRTVAWSWLIMATGAVFQGDVGRAASLFSDSLQRLRPFGDTLGIHYALIGLAVSAALRGDLLDAARRFGAAERYRETHGITLFSRHREIVDTFVAGLQSRLDPASLAQAWAEGRALTEAQALVEGI